MKANLRYVGVFILVLALHISVFAIQFKQTVEPEKPNSDAGEIDLAIIELAESAPEPNIVEEPAEEIVKEEPKPKPKPPIPPEPPMPSRTQPSVSFQQRYAAEITELKQKATEFIAKLSDKKVELDKAEEKRREILAQHKRKDELKRQQEREAQRKIEKKKQQALAKKRALQKAKDDEKARHRRLAQAKEKAKERAEARQRALAKQIVRKPSPVRKSMPSYPSSLRRKGIEGTVKMTLMIDSKGRVASVKLRQSSGHASFDKAALRAVKRWRYSPARNGLNQQVSYAKYETIVFQLN